MLLAANHYEALGVPRGASGAEAKKAFHKLALRLHPDKNKQLLAEEAFKLVEQAHRTIGDDKLRREYDLTLPVERNGGGARRAAPSYHYNKYQ